MDAGPLHLAEVEVEAVEELDDRHAEHVLVRQLLRHLELRQAAQEAAQRLRGRGPGDAVARNAAAFTWALPLALATAAPVAVLGRARIDGTGLALAVASGALASGLGYAVWYAALPGLTSARAALVQLTAPPLAAAGGVLLLGEPYAARLGVSSVLILGGIALASLAHRRRP